MRNQKTYISSQRKIVQFKKLILKKVNSSKIGVHRKHLLNVWKKNFFKCEFPLIFASFNSTDGLFVHSFNKTSALNWRGFPVWCGMVSIHSTSVWVLNTGCVNPSVVISFPLWNYFLFCCWLSLYITASFTWFYKTVRASKSEAFKDNEICTSLQPTLEKMTTVKGLKVDLTFGPAIFLWISPLKEDSIFFKWK